MRRGEESREETERGINGGDVMGPWGNGDQGNGDDASEARTTYAQHAVMPWSSSTLRSSRSPTSPCCGQRQPGGSPRDGCSCGAQVNDAIDDNMISLGKALFKRWVYSQFHRTDFCNVGTRQRCAALQSCRGFRFGAGNVS